MIARLIPKEAAVWDKCETLTFNFVEVSLLRQIMYLTRAVITAAAPRGTLQQQFMPNDTHGIVMLWEDLFSLRLTTTLLEGVHLFIKSYLQLYHCLNETGKGLNNEASATHVVSLLPSMQLHICLTVNCERHNIRQGCQAPVTPRDF